MAKFSEAVNAKIDANNTEQLNLLGKLSDEMTALRTDVNTRLSIVEKKVAKLEIDQNERLLELENANIALVEKNKQLRQEMININAHNNILAKNVDDLNQDKRNLNMYMVGLPQESQNKPGFQQFASEKLEITPEENDIHEAYIVGKTKKNEPILKVCFPTLDIRNKYFAAWKKLINNRKLWMREDLTKPRQHLAWLTRKAVEDGQFYRTWTSMGTVLAVTDPNTKPVRLDCPADIIRLGKPPRPKPNDLNLPVANIHMAPNSLSLPSSENIEMSTRTIMSDQGLQPTT